MIIKGQIGTILSSVMFRIHILTHVREINALDYKD